MTQSENLDTSSSAHATAAPSPTSSSAATDTGGYVSDPTPSRDGSVSRLNAWAPEFVPTLRAPPSAPPDQHQLSVPPPPPPAVLHVYTPSPPFHMPSHMVAQHPFPHPHHPYSPPVVQLHHPHAQHPPFGMPPHMVAQSPFPHPHHPRSPPVVQFHHPHAQHSQYYAGKAGDLEEIVHEAQHHLSPHRRHHPHHHTIHHDRSQKQAQSEHDDGASAEHGLPDEAGQKILNQSTASTSIMSKSTEDCELSEVGDLVTYGGCKFLARPGQGELGEKLVVKANHFSLELKCRDVYEYNVSITPVVSSRAMRQQIMEKLVGSYRASHMGNRLPIYDGNDILFIAGSLPFHSREFIISLEDGLETRQRTKSECKVLIKFTARVDPNDLNSSSRREASGLQRGLQVLGVILRQCLTTRCYQVRQSFYPYREGKQRTVKGVEICDGFHQSIRLSQMGFSLNVDASYTGSIESVPVIQFVSKLLDGDVCSMTLSEGDRLKINDALIGVKIKVTHQGDRRMTYRICGLTAQSAKDVMFPLDKGGTMISVDKYFHDTYDLVIQHKQLPCLQVGRKDRLTYFPMEDLKKELIWTSEDKILIAAITD